MASTRQIRIFQDPSTETSLQNASCHVSYDQEILLEPPSPASDGRSPLKPSQPRMTPPKARCGPLKSVSLPCPKGSDHPTDELGKPFHITGHHASLSPILDTAVFGDLPTFDHSDRGHRRQSHHCDSGPGFPYPAHGHTSLNFQRVDTNMVPLQSRPSKKARRGAPSQPCLPQPRQLPNPVDSLGKPNYSYAGLIGMAILRAENRRLTLAQIYKWISDTFSYYKISEKESGWQNSIRHNLSINKAFTKQERPRNDPGKGCYWTIMPGMEGQFLKEKTSRRPTSAAGPTMKTFSQPLNEPGSRFWPASANKAPKLVPQTPAVPEQPSSDGTIPASDVLSTEDFSDEFKDVPPPIPRLPVSSPCPTFGSSPPVVPHAEVDEGSPGLASDLPLPSVQPCIKKRKITAMDDSGYFSSLESSAIEGFNSMEADRPRIKRGRAEEEIARIRSSSHDLSPVKVRSLKQPMTPQFGPLSPLSDHKTFSMPPPLTPAVAFALPAKAPASVSPLTALRNHRNQVKESQGGSPPSDLSILGAEDYCTFGLHVGSHMDFPIFDENIQDIYSRPFSASPEKRSACRSRLAGSGKTAIVLADVTSSELNRTLLAQPSASPYSPIQKISATKYVLNQENRDSPMKGDWFRYMDDDEENDGIGGYDIKQGFPGIGRTQKPTSTSQSMVRPLLGARSHTSRF